MVIDKILNNNVITSLSEDDEEIVVMGKGIGFKKRSGDIIEQNKIEKIFAVKDPKAHKQMEELLQKTPEEYLIIVEKIVQESERVLDKELDKLIYLLLTDHLVFAVNRARQNISLQNPMIWEIRNLYKDEFKLGLWALKIVENEIGVILPEDEAAFIALHILNASLGEEMYNTMNITILTKDILRIIKSHFKVEYEQDSLDYLRLVTHLKFFSQRILKRQQVSDLDEELYELLVNKYVSEKKCIDKITKYIYREYNYELVKPEIMYLLLHIHRVAGK